MKWSRYSDVYSFGIVAFEVFSGAKLPFIQIPDEVVIKVLVTAESSIPTVLFSPKPALLSPAMFVNFFSLKQLCASLLHAN